MADQKIKITSLDSGTPVDTDVIPFVDVSDTTQSPEWTTKKALKSELKWDTWNGIASVTLISTVWLVKTYRITFTDATTFDFEVTDGTDGTDWTNGTDWADGADGRWIVSITRTSWDGSPWTTDTYTITYDKAPLTSTFDVYNGADGAGNVDSVNWKTGVVVIDPDDLDDTATTNKFTTAWDISKLAGIEAGADVTDTVNVTAAWALMDSEVTNLSQVKAFDSSDYATAAQWALADTALQIEVKSASFTAEIDWIYHVVANSTVTDPTTPVEWKGFTVLVRNGTATVGWTAYSTTGTIVKRTFHSGSYTNYVYKNNPLTSSDIGTTVQGYDANTTTASNTQTLTNKNLTSGTNTFPTFNQNTTGTASNVTGTVAIANWGTWATTESGARTNLKVPASDNTGITGADNITNIISLTTAEYTAIGTPSSTTLYIITDA